MEQGLVQIVLSHGFNQQEDRIMFFLDGWSEYKAHVLRFDLLGANVYIESSRQIIYKKKYIFILQGRMVFWPVGEPSFRLFVSMNHNIRPSVRSSISK